MTESEYPKGAYITTVSTSSTGIEYSLKAGNSFRIVFDRGLNLELNAKKARIEHVFGAQNPGIEIHEEFRYITKFREEEVYFDNISLHNEALSPDDMESLKSNMTSTVDLDDIELSK